MTNTVPRFIANPKAWMCQATSANTLADGSGTMVELLEAGNNGSKVELFTVRGAGEVKANTVRFFLSSSAGTLLWDEVVVSATSGPLAGQEMFNVEVQPTTALQLPPSWKVLVSIHTSDTINVFAVGGDY